MAMKGANCVAIASDLRFGKDLQMVTCDFSKCFEMSPHLWLGLTGLATDVQTVHQKMEFRKNMYELSESRTMKPKTFAAVLSNMLYERRFGPFFVNPVIAGLDPKTKEPFIAGMDLIGCLDEPEDYIVGGTSEEQLHGKNSNRKNIVAFSFINMILPISGMCEALWQPNMTPDELFECISQALTNAVDRDAASGWGAVVHIIEADKITTRKLKTRMD